MAIGGDQAGSIRIPASHCGIVGLKPTYGLVPYTGIAPLEMTLDTCGPMTASVAENALLLAQVCPTCLPLWGQLILPDASRRPKQGTTLRAQAYLPAETHPT